MYVDTCSKSFGEFAVLLDFVSRHLSHCVAGTPAAILVLVNFGNRRRREGVCPGKDEENEDGRDLNISLQRFDKIENKFNVYCYHDQDTEKSAIGAPTPPTHPRERVYVGKC